jgi:hypothetical protein
MSLSTSLFGVEEGLHGGCGLAWLYGSVGVVAVGVGWSNVQAELVCADDVGVIEVPFLARCDSAAASCASG